MDILNKDGKICNKRVITKHALVPLAKVWITSKHGNVDFNVVDVGDQVGIYWHKED